MCVNTRYINSTRGTSSFLFLLILYVASIKSSDKQDILRSSFSFHFFFLMNICQVPHLEIISHKHFTMATIALLSASEQTRCAVVASNFWMSDCSSTLSILTNHKSGSCALWLLHGRCHVKLLLSRCMFCTHHTAMYQFTVSVTFFEAAYVGLWVITFYYLQ